MEKENFFPKVTIKGTELIFNPETIETMELDSENASIVMIENTNPEKVKAPKELLIIKANGSLLDDPENYKESFSPDGVRKVVLHKENDEIVYGSINLPQTSIDIIKSVMGDDKNEFKLLACNTESALGKEFKEQFEIKNTYYRFAYLNDKRASVGKDKNVKENVEERIKF